MSSKCHLDYGSPTLSKFSFILEVHIESRRINAYSPLQTTHLLQNSITIIFCTWGTLANKFLVICYYLHVEQTGCYRIILMKKQMLYHRNFTRDSTFFTTQSVTMISPIVSLRVTTLTSIFSSSLSCQDLHLLAPSLFFGNISNPLLQTRILQRHFLLIIQLKSERKIADFRFFNTQLC